jgi:hypothetical protein
MLLAGASFGPDLRVKPQGTFLAAWIVALVDSTEWENRLTWMIPTVETINALEPLVTVRTFDGQGPSNDPPVKRSVSQELSSDTIGNELFEIKGPIRHMLSDDRSMKVNEDLSFWTNQLILGLQGEEPVAVGASLE